MMAVALLLVIVAPPLNAQAPYEPVRPEPASESWRWRTFPELARLGVRVVHPSRTGSLWIGAADGVFRFDGIEATRMEGAGAPEGPVVHLLETPDGDLLAATRRTIHRWDGSGWSREGPPGDPPWFTVRGFAQDTAGNVWAAATWGLLRLEPSPELLTTGDALEALSIAAPELNPRPVPPGILSATPAEETEGGVAFPDILRVHATADGWVWMVRLGGGLVRFNSGGDPLDPGSWTRFGQEDGLESGGSARVRAAPDGTVWSVSRSGLGGVNRFDGETWTSFRLSSIGGSDINPSVLPTRDGAVWVAGQSGLHVWRGGQWRVFTLSEVPVPGGNLRLEEDLAGRVWIVGSGGETVVLDQGSSRWTSLEGLSFEASSAEEGVNWYLDDTGRVVREGPGGTWRSFGPEHGLMNAPTAVVLDATGTPWAAGGHEGVAATARLEGDDGWTMTLHPELSWSIDYRAAFLAPDGVLWFGAAVDTSWERGQRGGVLSFDGTWTHHLPPAAPGSAYGIGATADGRLWVVGLDGLLVYDGTAWARVAEPEALSASIIDALHSPGDDIVWVGSRDDGVFRYSQGHWTRFGLTQGLPANGIVDVWSDEEGTWALTGAGLAHFDGTSWMSHGLGPGLPTARRGRLRRGLDGVLWLTTYQPSISGLTLNRMESPYRTRSIGIALDTLAPVTSLRAVPRQISRPGNLALSWTGADPWNVTAPTDLEFSVRVDDGAWSPFSRETSRFLDALPPGAHDIAVRAKDADGNVEVVPTAASVVVEPPVWQLFWFQLLVGSLVLVGLWQTRGVVVRDRRLRTANTELEDRVRERTRELEVAYRDLTRSVDDRTAIEGRLRQAQKMDALGRLAGGLAHDFNNLLTIISANTALTLLDANEEQQEDLKAVLQATQEAEALTGRLLALGRQQELEPVPLDLSAAVRNLLPLLKPLTRKGVELQLDLADGLPLVRHDPGQLQQVVLNIVMNAIDAMPDGGRVTIRTEPVELDAGYAAVDMDVVPGWYVMLAISDTGHGMDALTRDRIFEPFFTSKETGTGLGLATVYGIVRQSGAHIGVYSEPGEGTTFNLFFPTIPAEGHEGDAADLEGLRGTERVLVVEDDDVTRALISRALQAFGYSVLEAGSAAMARAIAAQEPPGSLDALVVDVFLGEDNGVDVARAAVDVHPDARTLFISGYDQFEVEGKRALEGAVILAKPVTQITLVRTLRGILDG
jgi:signal transduction histidine kinase